MAQQPPRTPLEEALAAGGTLRPQRSSPDQPEPQPSHTMTLEEALAQGGRLREGNEYGTGLYGIMPFLNRGIAESVTFGAGADPISQAMQRMGVVVSDRKPETLSESAAWGTGIAAGTLPGFGFGLARMAMTPGGVPRAIGEAFLSPFLRNPAGAITTELAAGGGAGAGSIVAGEEYGPLGEVVGGLGVGTAVATAPARMRILREASENVGRALQRWAFPFTEAGAQPRASAQLQLRSADPAMAGQRAGADTIGGLSPAQSTGEENLLALERVIRTRSPELEQQYQQQLARSEQALREAAEQFSGGGLEQYIDAAMRRAQAQISQMTPERQMSEASQVYTNELMDALAAARSTESGLWDIPNVRVRTENVRSRFNTLNRELPAAQSDDMPTVARRLLGRRPDPEPEDVLLVGANGETLVTRESAEMTRFRASEKVSELHGFFSEMREQARNARSAGRFNAARIADELADAAWQDLVGASDAPTSVGAQLQAAREYSRALNQTFRQGQVGRLLGYANTGERRVSGPEALERVLGNRGGAQAAITSEELTHAASFGDRDPTAAVGAIEDYIRRRFLLASAVDPDRPGNFSATGARNFLRRNEQLLQSHPELRRELRQTLVDMETADAVQNTRRVVAQAFNSENPASAIQQSREQLPRSETTSLRTGLIDYGLRAGRLDDQGNQIISGARLRGLLLNDRTRRAYAEIFSDEELGRLEQIASELEIVQRAQGPLNPTIPGTTRLEDPSTSRTGRVLTYIVGTIGARVGAVVGGRTSGASLRTAQRLSSMSERGVDVFMNKHSDKLLAEAATNPSLYRALMTPLNAPSSETESAERVLMRWMQRLARELGEDLAIPTAVGVGAVGAAGVRDRVGGRSGGPGPAQGQQP